MSFSISLNHWARKSTVIWILWRAGRLWPGLPQTDREGGKTTLRLETNVVTRLRQYWADVVTRLSRTWKGHSIELRQFYDAVDGADEPDGNCVDAARLLEADFGSSWDYQVSFPALGIARVVQSFWLFRYYYALYIVCFLCHRPSLGLLLPKGVWAWDHWGSALDHAKEELLYTSNSTTDSKSRFRLCSAGRIGHYLQLREHSQPEKYQHRVPGQTDLHDPARNWRISYQNVLLVSWTMTSCTHGSRHTSH